MMTTVERILATAIEAARAGGAVALDYYRRGFEVGTKTDDSPVTQADREAERAIVEVLCRAFPDYGVLGEEQGATGSREVRWIVDPIDGTRNFVRRIPLWAVLVGLEAAGEITAAVIYSPLTEDTYTASRGGGAYLNGQRLCVSETASLDQALLVHANLGSLRKAGSWDAFLRLVDATGRQRGFGDYLGFTLLAEGKAEIYAQVDVKPWDLAPCSLLVEEAGGRFTDFQGQRTIYGGSALATNGWLHDAALDFLRS